MIPGLPEHFFKTKPLKHLVVFAWIVLIFCGHSWSAIVYTSLFPDTMTVGDKITLQVSIIAPKNATISPPDITNGIGVLTVKDFSTTKVEKNNPDSIACLYKITAYQVEACTIPSLAFLFLHDSQTDTLYSEQKIINVASVVTGDTVDIKDIKPLEQAGNRPLLWIFIALALLVLAILIFIWYKTRKKHKEIENKQIELLPPYEEAIAALNALVAKGFINVGLYREFTFGISDILKRYIERSFLVTASEFTTEEILAWIEKTTMQGEEKKRLTWFFKTSDPVKFAKMIPTPEVASQFEYEIRAFLDATRPSLLAQAQINSSAQTTPKPTSDQATST